MTRYRWVDSRKAEGFAVTDACAGGPGLDQRVLRLAFHSQPGPHPIDIHRDSGGSYGAPRVSAALRQAGGRSTAIGWNG